MPRERIKHGNHYIEKTSTEGATEDSNPTSSTWKLWNPGDPIPDGCTVREDPSLDLNWNREAGWVQVSIEMTAAQWIVNADELRDGNVSHRAIYTDVLTRQEINHMIRTLRRARDAAYGSDE